MAATEAKFSNKQSLFGVPTTGHQGKHSFSSIAAASNLFLKEGDLLYWREKNKSVLGYQFSADSNTACLGGMKTLGSHKFP